MTKSGREIMEILEAFDLTRCAHSAAELAGVDEKTVARYVAIRPGRSAPLSRTRNPPGNPKGRLAQRGYGDRADRRTSGYGWWRAFYVNWSAKLGNLADTRVVAAL